ncbi:acid phosphatase phoa [Aulographum hederae CBS 113979]|uniref:Acid phosphatase phoa n=1 Tax=Aulographum hederae CBS 113979 TaxID=1176131 RepID=A0A6G1HBN5_9PEZI|nr:acid phosphatase phoa [Aulographum hederae CBS 113979]
MRVSTLAFGLFACGSVVSAQNTQTSPADVAAAAATAITRSPTSNVKGKAFDRIAIIWLENTDYDKAAGDPNLAYLAKKGITLSNYHGVTHPSEPNYVAAIGGDYFGMNNDAFNRIPSNVSTVIDLLDSKGISWGEYQEDLPYSGFEGFAWVNQKTGANDYVRKHNPAVIYDSVANSKNRLAQIKNLTMFHRDLEADKLPQWMFITPNMTSDGHDSSVTVAGTWTRNFVEPLLTNPKFMKNTLVLITFDENHTYTIVNKVLGILIGDAVPSNLVGTTDNTAYDHYSEIATVEANWGLHTLGRFDVGANVFSMVAAKTGDKLRAWTAPSLSNVYLNESYSGPQNDEDASTPYPAPMLKAKYAGRKVLPSIIAKYRSSRSRWGKKAAALKTYYTTNVEIPDAQHPPKWWTE